jgi:hypothetical protein
LGSQTTDKERSTIIHKAMRRVISLPIDAVYIVNMTLRDCIMGDGILAEDHPPTSQHSASIMMVLLIAGN